MSSLSSLNKKLFRDLWRMKGQALAIILVVACGVATYVMSISTYDSLETTRTGFNREYRFADIFASLKRAPESLTARLSEIPGIERIETRVVAPVTVDIEGFEDPVTGLVSSLPDRGEPLLNNLYLRSGRFLEPGRDNEVLLNEAFAKSHKIKPGESITITVNGRQQQLLVVGIALSPEHIFQISPTAFYPDFKRYGVMWMNRSAISTAYNMEGAFNDVVISLSGERSEEEVLERLDLILEPYGSRGGYGREYQLSHRYLTEELKGLQKMATVYPVIFLGVAAFLLNVVMTRMISTEREQIAILKAFGYDNLEVGYLYFKLVLIISAIGLAIGIYAGVWLGENLSNLYMEFYRFPYLNYVLRPSVVIISCLISLLAAISGTLLAVRRAVKLSPAVAMRPEPPVSYRATFIERLGLQSFISQPGRMILRHLERRPVKSLMTVVGIAFGCAIMVMGTCFGDAIDYMIDVEFNISRHDDLIVSFIEPTSGSALNELKSLEGVFHAEPFRSVPVKLVNGHKSYRTTLEGTSNENRLSTLLDQDLKKIELPPEGIVLTEHLGKLLGVRPGDRLTIEVLEGERPIKEAQVAALVKQFVGVSAYMEIDALARFMREGSAISGVRLTFDPTYRADIYSRLKDMPRVAGSLAREDALQNFNNAMAEQIYIFIFFIISLATIIAFGVVYNSARIALAERQRELGSLRVLGYTRGEVSYILLGELAILTLLAIPLGFIIGRGLAKYIIDSMQTELYRIPLVIESDTYALSALVVLIAAVISGIIVREKLDHLDLVEVLKTKE